MSEQEKELGKEFNFFKSKPSFKNKWNKLKTNLGYKIGSLIGYTTSTTYSLIKGVSWSEVINSLILTTESFFRPIFSITAHALFVSFLLSYLKVLPIDKQISLIQGHEVNQLIFSLANLYFICWTMGSILKFLYSNFLYTNALGKDMWVNIWKPFQLILLLAFFVPNPDGITPIAQIITYFIKCILI